MHHSYIVYDIVCDIRSSYRIYIRVCYCQALLLTHLLHQAMPGIIYLGTATTSAIFNDQQYSPPSPMSHYPGSLNPLVHFLSDIPDWNSFDKSALDHALQGLPVPIAGPAPQGISLQDAIKVKSPPPCIRYRIRYLTLIEI